MTVGLFCLIKGVSTSQDGHHQVVSKQWMLERMWIKGALLHCWWQCSLIQPLWRIQWRFLKRDPTPEYISGENHNMKTFMPPSVHSSTIYNNPDMEATSMSSVCVCVCVCVCVVYVCVCVWCVCVCGVWVCGVCVCVVCVCVVCVCGVCVRCVCVCVCGVCVCGVCVVCVCVWCVCVVYVCVCMLCVRCVCVCCVCVCVCAQLCPTVCNPTDYSPPDSSVHGIFQARIMEQVAISFVKMPRGRDKEDVVFKYIYIYIYIYTHTHTHTHTHWNIFQPYKRIK